MRPSRSATRLSVGSFGSRYLAFASAASRAMAGRGEPAARQTATSRGRAYGCFMRGAYAQPRPRGQPTATDLLTIFYLSAQLQGQEERIVGERRRRVRLPHVNRDGD